MGEMVATRIPGRIVVRQFLPLNLLVRHELHRAEFSDCITFLYNNGFESLEEKVELLLEATRNVHVHELVGKNYNCIHLHPCAFHLDFWG